MLTSKTVDALRTKAIEVNAIAEFVYASGPRDYLAHANALICVANQIAVVSDSLDAMIKLYASVAMEEETERD